jgi:hypothetical protein
MVKKPVASASRKKPKKARAIMDHSVVRSYLAELVANLGDDEGFSSVFHLLETDKNVRQPEAVAIGSEFVAPMAASTARAAALERIWKRHKSLMSFKLKQRAVGGRSAA